MGAAEHAVGVMWVQVRRIQRGAVACAAIVQALQGDSAKCKWRPGCEMLSQFMGRNGV